MNKIKSICVYCGSSNGEDPLYIKAAEHFGQLLAEAGIKLVYGGGTKGIMGAVSRGVKNNGGVVTGIIPEFLTDKEATAGTLTTLDELIVTETMHQRKTLMFERSDAFVTLPGGIGTLEEIVEIMTWAQLGHHQKPMVFVSINDFWKPMESLLAHMIEEGFIHTHNLVRPIVVNHVEAVIPAILDKVAQNGS